MRKTQTKNLREFGQRHLWDGWPTIKCFVFFHYSRSTKHSSEYWLHLQRTHVHRTRQSEPERIFCVFSACTSYLIITICNNRIIRGQMRIKSFRPSTLPFWPIRWHWCAISFDYIEKMKKMCQQQVYSVRMTIFGRLLLSLGPFSLQMLDHFMFMNLNFCEKKKTFFFVSKRNERKMRMIFIDLLLLSIFVYFIYYYSTLFCMHAMHISIYYLKTEWNDRDREWEKWIQGKCRPFVK